MHPVDIQRRLGQLAFAADLPAAVVADLAQATLLQTFSAGEVIFAEGGERHVLYIIASGCVGLDMRVPGRGDVRVLTLGSGDILGWSAILGGGEMTATARAVENSEVVAIASHKLQAIFEQNPQVGYTLMHRIARALSQRLLATRLQMLDLFNAQDQNP